MVTGGECGYRHKGELFYNTLSYFFNDGRHTALSQEASSKAGFQLYARTKEVSQGLADHFRCGCGSPAKGSGECIRTLMLMLSPTTFSVCR